MLDIVKNLFQTLLRTNKEEVAHPTDACAVKEGSRFGIKEKKRYGLIVQGDESQCINLSLYLMEY